MTSHVNFDFADLTERQRYELLIGTVVPRPIAFVTTLGRDGRANAAPFSFFNVLTHDPAIVAIGVENHPDFQLKDTSRNIRETEEFTVHICDDALVEQMEICAIKFGPDVDELALSGLETVPGKMVRSPRIVSAPAALECRRKMILELGKAREIILGEVVGLFVREDAVNRETLHIDQHTMDAVGRMGGHSYARTRDQFEVKTLSVDEWERRQATRPLAGTGAA